MKTLTVDVLVLGAGTAGLAAYRAAKGEGKSALLVEGGPYGTTCARVGCMPSKLLIAAAEAHHSVHRLEAFGIDLPSLPVVDGTRVMDRVTRERDRFVGFVLDGVDRIPESDKIKGYARYLGPHLAMVEDHTRIEFRSSVIATGSRPVLLPFLKAAGDRLIVNDEVFHWSTLPQSVAVFGPGVIGLELGQALHRLGVRVRIFGARGISAGLTDPKVKAMAERLFASELPLECYAKVTHLERRDAGVMIEWTSPDGQSHQDAFEWVLAATGRSPNIEHLGIETLGIEVDQAGVPIFNRETLQCGDQPIFIAGDANADVPLLHEAADEGRIAGVNAARFPRVAPGLRRSPLAIVFSDPEIASVGQRYQALDLDRTVIGEVSFEDQGRSRVMLKNKGLLRVYVDLPSGDFLGAEMIGPDAEHLAHLLAWAHQAQMNLKTMLDMPFYHPVIEEGLRTALRDADAKRQEWVHKKRLAESALH